MPTQSLTYKNEDLPAEARNGLWLKPFYSYLNAVGILTKIKVELGMKCVMETSIEGFLLSQSFMTCKIINRQDEPVFIDKINLKTTGKLNYCSSIFESEFHKNVSLPFKIEKNKQCKFDYKAIDFSEFILLNLENNNKVKFEITLLNGEIYNSNSLSKLEIENYLGLDIKQNEL